MIKNKEELNFLIIADQPRVKEELDREDMRRMRLEIWHDKEGNQKETSWIVDKEEFTEKNLAQNFILNSAITGERTEMIMIKVPLTDEKAREIIRKARGIDVTETIFRDKKIAEEYQDHEFWLLEKVKVPSHLL